MRSLKHHPYAAIFPLMDDEQIAALADDIREHGQRNAVIVDGQGFVIDGRNRLAACLLAAVEPRIETIDCCDREKLQLVMSLNMNRRHLNESQRAMVAARASAAMQAILDSADDDTAEDDDDEQPADATDASAETIAANLPRDKRPRDLAAQLMSVSPRSVQDAVTVLQSGDQQAVSSVDRGDTAVSAAANKIRREAALTRQAAAGKEPERATSKASSSAPGPLSRQERAGLKRDIEDMIRAYDKARRPEVAEWIVSVCQRFLG